MDRTPTPDLRPLLTRIVDRLLHVRREPPPCAHCEHVTELRTQMRVARWIIGIVLGALVTVLVRDLVSYLGQRVRWAPPPGQSGAVLPGIDGHK